MHNNKPTLISFCVNTSKNELAHLKLLFQSFQTNLSTLEHEFIIFVDSDNQNTFDWLLGQKATFPNLKVIRNVNIPYCNSAGQNILFKEASHEIVSYLHSDMVVCKDYDVEILKYLKEDVFLCSTRIEPPLHGNSGEKITQDFTTDPTTFDMVKFTDYAQSCKQDRLTNYFFAPYTMYKKVWLEIGGHDVQFRRSREDSDIYTRLVLNNIKVQQAWNAIVYHFTCTSSRGLNWFDSTNKEAQNRIQLQNIADQFELFKFMRKWGKFHHSYTKPKYYNITAIINGDFNATSAQKITFIEPFFKKIQFQDTKFIDHIKAQYNQSQEPANTILSISKDQWDEYKYFFQTDIVTNRLLPISEQDSDISVKFDIDEIGQEDITGFIHNLQDIIDGVEDTGHFEYGPFFITINQKVDRASDNIRVINPELKPEHLYTIH